MNGNNTFDDHRRRIENMGRVQRQAFANELRSAREAALKDAEAFDGIIHAVERLGKFLLERSTGDLGHYKPVLAAVANLSSIAVADRWRGLRTPFYTLFELVREARNDAFHQGASARHLTGHAIELALMLEDGLRNSETPTVSDYMVRNPVCAELWQPLGFIRQQMLASSFSFLPIQNQNGHWCFISDRALALFLSSDPTQRKERLARTAKDVELSLDKATFVEEDTTLSDALGLLKDTPLLVRQKSEEREERLLGIVTAFDLL